MARYLVVRVPSLAAREPSCTRATTCSRGLDLVNRPGVARAVLQSPL